MYSDFWYVCYKHHKEISKSLTHEPFLQGLVKFSLPETGICLLLPVWEHPVKITFLHLLPCSPCTHTLGIPRLIKKPNSAAVSDHVIDMAS